MLTPFFKNWVQMLYMETLLCFCLALMMVIYCWFQPGTFLTGSWVGSVYKWAGSHIEGGLRRWIGCIWRFNFWRGTKALHQVQDRITIANDFRKAPTKYSIRTAMSNLYGWLKLMLYQHFSVTLWGYKQSVSYTSPWKYWTHALPSKASQKKYGKAIWKWGHLCLCSIASRNKINI